MESTLHVVEHMVAHVTRERFLHDKTGDKTGDIRLAYGSLIITDSA